MQRSPRVTIGLPVYNGARYLREALDSIVGQTFTDLEVVICDNASTDGTEAICREYANRDERIRYFRNERNMGASYNYNRTFELARGEFFKHAAHDDLIAPAMVEKCVAEFDANPKAVLVYPQMQIIDADGRPGQVFSDSLQLHQSSAHERWSACLRKVTFNSMCDPVFGIFRSSALRKTPVLGRFTSADMILLAEISLYGEVREVPEVLFFERWHAGTSVNANPTRDDRACWFDPELRGRLSNQLVSWTWLSEYFKAVNRAQIGLGEKLRCYARMPQWAYEHKRWLLYNLGDALRYAAKHPESLKLIFVK